nr:unnamed protein product [Spirometra erinaceieuropaei]
MTYAPTRTDDIATLTVTDTEGRVLRREERTTRSPWARDRHSIKTGIVRPLLPVALSTNCSVDLSPEGVCVRDSIEFEFTCPNGETHASAVNGSSQDYRTHGVNRTKGDRWHWQAAATQSPQYDHQHHQSGQFARQVDKCTYRGDQAVVHHQIGASSDYLFTFDRQQLHPPLTNNIELEVFSPRRRVIYLEPRELPHPGCTTTAQHPRYLDAPSSKTMSSSGLTAEQKISSRRDEQERVQKKTFTNWVNTYLSKVNPPIRVGNLYEDIKDGICLIRLLEVLSRESLPVDVAVSMKRAHCLSNVRTALEFLKSRQLKLVNINASDIVDGKPTIVLGLIWSIILYFQIEEQEDMLLELLGISRDGVHNKTTAKKALTTWIQNAFSEKYNLDIKDFGPSWRDGVAFNAIVHSINPKLVDMQEVAHCSNRENLHRAFSLAEEELGIPKLLDPEDVDVDKPDEKSIMTYVAQFYKAYPEAGKPKTLSIDEEEKQEYTKFLDVLRATKTNVDETLRSPLNLEKSFEKYEQMCARLDANRDFVDLLRQKLTTDRLVGGLDPQAGLNDLAECEKALEQWRWRIYDQLPGDFSESGRWMRSAEQWLSRVDAEWKTDAKDSSLSGTIPNPAEANVLADLSKGLHSYFGSDCAKANSAADRLRKLVTQKSADRRPKLPQKLTDLLLKRMSAIVESARGYVVTVHTASERRDFIDLMEGPKARPELLSLLEDASELASGRTPGENVSKLRSTLKELQEIEKSFGLSEPTPITVQRLQNGLQMIEKCEKEQSPLPTEMSSSVIREWIDHTQQEHHIVISKFSITEIINQLSRRIAVWSRYEEKLNEAVNQMAAVYDSVKRDAYTEGSLATIDGLLTEAEAAAEDIGRQDEIRAVQISRRQFEELQHTVTALEKRKSDEERSLREESEKSEQEFGQLLVAVSGWNARVDSLLSWTKLSGYRGEGSIQDRIAQKTSLLEEALKQLDELEGHLQEAEHLKQSAVNSESLKKMDEAVSQLAANQKSLENQLACLQRISASHHRVETTLSRAKELISDAQSTSAGGTPRRRGDMGVGKGKITRTSSDVMEEVDAAVEDLLSAVDDLRKQAADSKPPALIQDLDFEDLFKSTSKITEDWKEYKARAGKDEQQQNAFWQLCERTGAMMDELSKHFDALETEIGSTNRKVAEEGMQKLRELGAFIDAELRQKMEELKATSDALLATDEGVPTSDDFKRQIKSQVDALLERHADLLERRSLLCAKGDRASERHSKITASKEALERAVRTAKDKLGRVQTGPDFSKSPARNLDKSKTWLADCEAIFDLLNSSQHYSIELDALFSDLHNHDSPMQSEAVAVQEAYHSLREDVIDHLESVRSFVCIYEQFQETLSSVASTLTSAERAISGRRTTNVSLEDYGSLQLRIPHLEEAMRSEEALRQQLKGLQDLSNQIRDLEMPKFSSAANSAQRETEAIAKRVDECFEAIHGDYDRVMSRLREHSDLDSRLAAFEKWLEPLESRLAQQSPSLEVPVSMETLLQRSQGSALQYAEVSSALNSAGPAQIADLVETAATAPVGGFRERAFELKSRLAAAIKSAETKEHQVEKELSAWKEAILGLRDITASLGAFEETLTKLEEHTDVQPPPVLTVEKLARFQQKSLAANLRQLDDMAAREKDVEKRLTVLRQRVSKSSDRIEDLRQVGERQKTITDRRQSLQRQLQTKMEQWERLSEAAKALDRVLESFLAEAAKVQLEHSSSAAASRPGQKLRAQTSALEAVARKETDSLTLLQSLQAKVTGDAEAGIQQLASRIQQLSIDLAHCSTASLTNQLTELVDREFDRAASLQHYLDDQIALQISLTQSLSMVITAAKDLETDSEDIKKQMDSLTKKLKTDIEGSKCQLEDLEELRTRLEQQSGSALSELESSVERAKSCYQTSLSEYPLLNLTPKSRSPPSCLNTCVEEFRRFIGDQVERLQKMIGDLNASMEEVRVATEKLNAATETACEVKEEIADLLGVEQVDAETIDSCNEKFQLLKTTVPKALTELKKLLQQVSRSRAPGLELKDAINHANSVLAETQADFDRLKSHMQTTSTSWAGFCSLAEEIFEAVSSNMATLRQAVHLKLPIANPGELRTRLSELKDLMKDCNYAVDALVSKAAGTQVVPKCCTTAEFGMELICDKVRRFLVQSGSLPASTTESKLEEIGELVRTYSEWLSRAAEEVASILKSAEDWFNSANQLEGQLKVTASEVESEAARPPPSLNFSDTQDTARDIGLSRVRSLEQEVLTSHSDGLERLQRAAEDALSDSGFTLSSITAVQTRLGQLVTMWNGLKTTSHAVVARWEKFAADQSELRPLARLAESLITRYTEDCDSIESRLQNCTSSELQSLHARLTALKEESRSGDEIFDRFRALGSASEEAFVRQLCQRWEEVSQKRVDALAACLAEETQQREKEDRELAALQVWLNNFQSRVAERCIQTSSATQSTEDMMRALEELRSLREQLEKWETDCLKPQLLRSSSAEKVRVLSQQSATIARQLDESHAALSATISEQKLSEARLNELSGEINHILQDLNKNFDFPSVPETPVISESRGKLISLQESIDELVKSRRHLMEVTQPQIETLHSRLMALESENWRSPPHNEIAAGCRQNLQLTKQTVEGIEKRLQERIHDLEEFLAASQQFDQWLRENERVLLPTSPDRRITIEAAPTTAASTASRAGVFGWDQAECQANARRIQTQLDARQQNLLAAKSKLAKTTEGAGKLERLREMSTRFHSIDSGRKTESRYLPSQLLEEIVQELQERYQQLQQSLEGLLSTSETAHQRACTLLTSVRELDALAFKVYSSATDASTPSSQVELLNESLLATQTQLQVIRDLAEVENQQATAGRHVFQEQCQRGERLQSGLETRLRSCEAKQRATAAEQEALTTQLTDLRAWLQNWEAEFAELEHIHQIELNVLVTKPQSVDLSGESPITGDLDSLPPDLQGLHSMVKLGSLQSQVTAKRAEFTRLTEKLRESAQPALEAASAGPEASQLGRDLNAAERKVAKFRSEAVERLWQLQMLRTSIGRARAWLREKKTTIPSLLSDEGAPLSETNRGEGTFMSQSGVDQLNVLLYDVESAAGDIRQALSNALALLRRPTGSIADALLQTASREVDCVQQDISLFLETLAESRKRLNSRQKMRAEFNALARQAEFWFSDAVARLRCMLEGLRSDGLVSARSHPSPVASPSVFSRQASPDRSSPPGLRLDLGAGEISSLPRNLDNFIQELKELGQKLETASNEHFAFMQVNQNFNRWIQQKMELAQLDNASFQNLAQAEDVLCKLRNLEQELLAGVEQQQTLAEATNRASAASSRALRAVNAAYAALGRSGSGGRHGETVLEFPSASQASSPNRHELPVSWMSEEAAATEEKWRSLKLDVTQKIQEFESIRSQLSHITQLQSNLSAWIAATEAKMGNASLESDTYSLTPNSDRSVEAAWQAHVEETKALAHQMAAKDAEIQTVQNLAEQIQSAALKKTVGDLIQRYQTLRTSVREYVQSVFVVQRLSEEFRATIQAIDDWNARVLQNLTPGQVILSKERSPSPTEGVLLLSARRPDVILVDYGLVERQKSHMREVLREGRELVDRANNLVHQLGHCALHGLERSQLECWQCQCRPHALSEGVRSQEEPMLQSLTISKTPMSWFVFELFRRYQTRSTSYQQTVKAAERVEAKLDGLNSQWEDFCRLVECIQRFHDDELPAWWQRTCGPSTPMDSSTASPSPANATSLEEVSRMIASTTTMCQRLNDKKMELLASARRFKNVRSSSSWSQNLPSTTNADLADVRSPITIPHLAGVFSILDDCVQATVDRLLTWLDSDASKLELFSQELHKLEDRWKAYTTDRDAFKSWLCDRSTIGRLLRDPEPASTSAVDTDSAAIESLCRNPRLLKVYLEEIRERGDRLQTLLRTFDNLTAHSPGAVDQVLRQLEHDYYSISTRLELRLRCRDKKWPPNAIQVNLMSAVSSLAGMKRLLLQQAKMRARTTTTTEGDTKTKEASRSYQPIPSTDLAKAESPQNSQDDFTALKTGRRYHSVDRQPTHSALAELTDIRDRTRALENLLNTVKHIKYDAQRAESAAERR